MYIRRKVFSYLTDEMGKERLFSTTEFSLDEVTFARKDYEGLTEEGKKVLKERRDAYAKSLRKNYRDTMANIDRVGGNYKKLGTEGRIKGGGVETNYKVTNFKSAVETAEDFVNTHKNAIRSELGKQSKNAGEIMRGETMAKYREIPKAKPVAQEIKNEIVKKAEDAGKRVEEVIADQAKKGLKLTRNQKIAGAAIGTTALIGAGTYAYKKHKDKKNKKE